MLPGIDVSRYQKNIDWGKVVAAGIKFVFIRATQGRSYTDPYFEKNYAGAKAAGLPVGAYHFFTPTQDAVGQAKHFLEVTDKMVKCLPPVLDVEDSGALSVVQYQESMEAWLNHVELMIGRKPIIYANMSYLSKFKLVETFPDNPFWYARYNKTAPAGDWLFWQHTSSGKVDGITGNVDLDWFRGEALSDEAQLKALIK